MSSELIRAHQSSSELIRAHQSSSELIRGAHLRRRVIHKEGLIDRRSPRESFHSSAHVAREVGDHQESLVARGAQAGQLMRRAISKHSEARSEASSEVIRGHLGAQGAAHGGQLGDRGRVRGKRLVFSDRQAARTGSHPRSSPGHRRACEGSDGPSTCRVKAPW